MLAVGRGEYWEWPETAAQAMVMELLWCGETRTLYTLPFQELLETKEMSENVIN